MPDSHDPGEFVCANCGRSTFTPPTTLTFERDREAHLHGRGIVVGGRGRELGIPVGFINPAIRRLA